MSIGNESRQTEQFQALTGSDSATATGNAAVVYDILQPITVLRVGVLVTTAISSAADMVIYFDKRVTVDSDSNRILGLNGTTSVVGDAVVNVPTATAAGDIVYTDVRVDLDPGQQIVVDVHTAATVSGAQRYYFEYINRHETAANFSNMSESS